MARARARTAASAACPCGLGPYAECCGPAHAGHPAATPEALMRSRYSAYARGDLAYLRRTWHPQTRPADLAPEPGLRWIRLEVLDAEGGGLFDAEGVVEFRAHYRDQGRPGVLDERSRFVRHDGKWVYWGPVLTNG